MWQAKLLLGRSGAHMTTKSRRHIPSDDDGRKARVAERIRQEVMELVSSDGLRDPALVGLVVHRVRLTPDLGLARFYVRLDRPADRAAQKQVIRGLRRASGYLRNWLAQRLGLRKVPALEFFWDELWEEQMRVEKLLESIADESDDEAP